MLKKLITAAAVTAATLSSVHADELKGRGASFPAPVYKAWTSEYFKATGNKINYTPTGSGEGIKSIEKRMVDFAGSDKPLKPKTLARHKLHMFPTVVGSIVLAYNLEGIADGTMKLSRAAIAAIFDGRATKWNDPVIAKDNPELKLPNEPITVCVRADKSGTTFNFTYFLHQIDPSFKASKKPQWKAAKVVAGKSNSGVTANIKNIKGSIGYIEYSYKLSSKLPAAQVQNKAGKFINPTVKSFQDAAKYASWTADKDFYAVIGDPDGDTSYPVVAATFILLPAGKAATDKKVAAFFDWAFQNGDKAAADLGYVPLPVETKDAIGKYWADKGIK